MTHSTLLATIGTDTLRLILVDARAKGDHVAARLVDTELFYRQPIVTGNPVPGHWTATRGDYDLDCTVGWGSTRCDAIADLLDREDDLRADEVAGIDYGMVEERERHP
jgi:hypothetical protein